MTMDMSVPPRPRPVLDDLNRPFWEAAANRRLEVQKCDACGHLRYPVSICCPKCLSEDSTWEALSGLGTVFSYIVFHQVYHQAFADEVPYNVALIQLDEGPRMFSNVVCEDNADVKVGDRVTVVFDRVEDFVLPRFELA